MSTKILNLEYKILKLLKKNSRISISDISENTGADRRLISRLLKDLERKEIVCYTAILKKETERLALVTFEGYEGNRDFFIESFRLLDGKECALIPVDDIYRFENCRISMIQIIKERIVNHDFAPRTSQVCEYCGNEITNNPVTFIFRNREHTVCCNNCQRDLMRILEKS
ncbi:TRASH domain-containing protein [Caldiplasma sukawensis]